MFSYFLFSGIKRLCAFWQIFVLFKAWAALVSVLVVLFPAGCVFPVNSKFLVSFYQTAQLTARDLF